MILDRLPKTTFKNVTIADITKGVKLKDFVFQSTYYLTDYEIKDDMRPDVLADLYYDDAKLAWFVLLPNIGLDPYYEWPLTQREFNAFMIKKYGDTTTAQATILHYTHNTKNLTVSKDTYDHAGTMERAINVSEYTAVDAFSYYEDINNNRRIIKLVEKEFLSILPGELKRLFN